MIKNIDEKKLQEFMDSLPAITEAARLDYPQTHTPMGTDAFRLRLEARICPCCGQTYCQRWRP